MAVWEGVPCYVCSAPVFTVKPYLSNAYSTACDTDHHLGHCSRVLGLAFLSGGQLDYYATAAELAPNNMQILLFLCRQSFFATAQACRR